MPFRKVGSNKYMSPSGRKLTKRQVKLYYATDGFKTSLISHKQITKNLNQIHRKKGK